LNDSYVRRLTSISLAWAVTLGYFSGFKRYLANWITIARTVIHTVTGPSMLIEFKIFVAEAHELERKIQFDVLAILVAATIVIFLTIRYCEIPLTF